MLIIILIITIVCHTLSTTSVSGSEYPELNETLYVGCFEGAWLTSGGYYCLGFHKVNEGVTICTRKLTRYIGIAINNRYTESRICCGNDLRHFEARDDSLCTRLTDGPSILRYGSIDDLTMAVYRLRDETPLAILSATDNGTQFWREDTQDLTIVAADTSAHDVDYYYAKDQIFTLDGMSIHRYSLEKYKPHPLKAEVNGATDIVFDWVRRDVYWSNSRGPTYHVYRTKVLMLESMRVGVYENIATTKHRVKDLTIDPYSRILFFVDEAGSVISHSLEKGSSHNYTDSPEFPLLSAKYLAVDFHQRRILAVGRTVEDDYCLISVNYEAQEPANPTIIFKGPQLTNPYSIDFFNNEVVWVNTNHGEHVYKCPLSPKCEPRDVEELFSTSKSIYDVKVYDPEKQTPPEWYLCQHERCSGPCTRRTLFSAHCGPTPGPAGDSTTADVSEAATMMYEPTQPTTNLMATTGLTFSAEIDKLNASILKILVDAKPVDENKESSLHIRVLILEILFGTVFMLIVVFFATKALTSYRYRIFSNPVIGMSFPTEMKAVPNEYTLEA